MKLFINTGSKRKGLCLLTTDIFKPVVEVVGRPIFHNSLDQLKICEDYLESRRMK